MIYQLFASVKKEFLLLLRDWHSMLLLFVMPAIFIVLMSLAMQNNFSARSETQLAIVVADQASNSDSEWLLKTLRDSGAFRILDDLDKSDAELERMVRFDKASFMLTITSLAVSDEELNPLAVALLVAPSTSKPTEAIFVATLQESLRGLKVEKMLVEMEGDMPGSGGSLDSIAAVELSVQYAYESSTSQSPTAVQQNVPAWLVFAMFFVVIPFSNTLINERQMGTLRRIRTIDVSPVLMIVAKLFPYFVIMQIQVVVMLLVGAFLVPLLGGDSLRIGNDYGGMLIMSSALALAALGYATLIAVVAKTTEQATTLGGAGNIILAAIGGIMVPKFVMPAGMQKLSEWSPMNWGLEGFLDIFLRNGGIALMWPKALSLVMLGLVLLMLGLFFLSRKKEF